ncbi:MAG: anaphase promoting complex subunit doc1 [Icmadophila ericetorum]|nr:anaphase promoting complex subunit doc1 [Icmadophila ericetorum]
MPRQNQTTLQRQHASPPQPDSEHLAQTDQEEMMGDENLSSEEDEGDGVEEDDEEEEEGDEGKGAEEEEPEIADEEAEALLAAAKESTPSLAHLREISPLASWTVSTHKPGCGIPSLLSPSTTQFWQSDGPQPHYLNIHFFKCVEIVKLRVYLDFELDESYTPTRMQFLAGMGDYGLVVFGEWRGEQPRGWVEVELEGCGPGTAGGEDGGEEGERGGVLKCMVLQIKILENHQNGKDTHVRGVQIFARDERAGRGGRAGGGGNEKRVVSSEVVSSPVVKRKKKRPEERRAGMRGVFDLGGLSESGWMREPELR